MALAELCYAAGARFWCRQIGDERWRISGCQEKRRSFAPKATIWFSSLVSPRGTLFSSSSPKINMETRRRRAKRRESLFPPSAILIGVVYVPIGQLRRQLLGRKKKSRHLYFPILLLYGAGYDGNREKTKSPWSASPQQSSLAQAPDIFRLSSGLPPSLECNVGWGGVGKGVKKSPPFSLVCLSTVNGFLCHAKDRKGKRGGGMEVRKCRGESAGRSKFFIIFIFIVHIYAARHK